jgi:mRNA interferase MazF
MNRALRTVIVAPMTTAARTYPTRVDVTFQGKKGQLALDQLRSVDRTRLLKRLGRLPSKVAEAASGVLVEMFSRA